MTKHSTGTHEEWLAARLALLAEEKELTRKSDELAQRRQALPWVRVDKPYRLQTEQGSASLAELFRGRSQLIVYHFMFGPDYAAGCASCSSIADGFNGVVPHLEHHDVAFTLVSRAPIDKLLAYRKRMGWSVQWASSYGSDFGSDFHVRISEEEQRLGTAQYNFRQEGKWEARSLDQDASVEGPVQKLAGMSGTDVPTYTRDRPGLSAFVLDGGAVYHTYSTYSRGLDGMWGMYQLLDRAPLGRNETGVWWRRHDEYERAAAR